ncbi:MAG TPA: hypothetical protein VHX87_09765 [Galbitalea sp.]|jgi:hypothetical protein|nr:hypothetical protein [Galbitalea sp.]
MATIEFVTEDYVQQPQVVLASFVNTVFDDVDAMMAMLAPLLERSIPRRRRASDESRAFLEGLSRAWESARERRAALTGPVGNLRGPRLERRGLKGSELEAKMLAWDLPRSQLRADLLRRGRTYQPEDAITQPNANSHRILPLPRVTAFKQFLVRRPTLKGILNTASTTLRYANILLGSILKELPGGEFFLEITELIENVTKDVADSKYAGPAQVQELRQPAGTNAAGEP